VSVTCAVFVAPFLVYVIVTLGSGCFALTAAMRSSGLRIFWSVGCRRALRDASDLRAVAGRGQLDAEVSVLDLAVGEQLLDDLGHRVRRDREADALAAATFTLDLAVDADHLATHVQEP
jgi:hypothetical protein